MNSNLIVNEGNLQFKLYMIQYRHPVLQDFRKVSKNRVQKSELDQRDHAETPTQEYLLYRMIGSIYTSHAADRSSIPEHVKSPGRKRTVHTIPGAISSEGAS